MGYTMADLRLRRGFGGGKGNDLKRARLARVRVPTTFSIIPEEVAPLLAALPEYEEAIESWCVWSADAVDSLSQFREAILKIPEPTGWNIDYKNLANELSKTGARDKWIVRSSMNVENLGHSSFAGVYESIPVSHPNASSVWSAVLKVLASGFQETAAKQLLSMGLSPRDFKPGAILQAFVPGVISGVCFSRNPKTPWAYSPVAEWLEGSAEDVVQGTRETHQTEFGEKKLAFHFFHELWKITELMELIFLQAVDLEWTWDGQSLWILQVRPVVGLASELAPFTTTRRWNRELARERFPEKMSRLGWTAIEDLIPSNLLSIEKDFGVSADLSSPMTIYHQGIVYSDPDFFKPGRVNIKWSRYLDPFGRHFYKILRALFRLSFRKVRGVNSSISSGLLKLDLVDAFIGEQARRLASNWETHVIQGRIEITKLDIESEKAPLDPAYLLRLMETLRTFSLGFLAPDLPIYVVKDLMNKALESFWVASGRAAEELSWILSSFEGNQTLNVGERWEEIATLAKTDEKSASLKFAKFLEEHGHMRTSWDLALPNWKEQKETIWSLISESAPLSKSRDLKSKAAHGFFQWYEELVVAKLKAKELQRVRYFIELQKTFMRIDEDLHYLSGLLVEPSRKLVLKSAQLLVNLGLIENREDVFYLDLKELKTLLKNPDVSKKFLIAKRKSEEARWDKLAPEDLPPKSEGASSRSNSKIQAASPGQAGGPIFFVEHLEDAVKVPRGAILVTTAPNPSFIPLYPRLAGIATITGGMLSHGFVAAREYGIPAISGISELENRKNGDWLEIDGSLGLATWGKPK